jgi:CheY-like chemotaxis protein
VDSFDFRVDLILLDMVMPKGINGRETYEQIIKIRPGQKAVIASGYAKTKEVDIAKELGAGKYIKKPYTLEKRLYPDLSTDQNGVTYCFNIIYANTFLSRINVYVAHDILIRKFKL